ncbi:MAG: hypothetical protein D3925_14050 [Candidatus Electrothrix sp. AR5]|nr:hypothetical protein [Candidatus Electrothrix sp. AR5]
MKIFLSVGATYNKEQELFISAFETFLGQNGCEKLTLGRGYYSSDQPINAVRELMKTADACVVLAFTRTIIVNAIDKPDSEEQKNISDEKKPTVWNQMEAAMAFGLDLPLLVIIESGLKQEAMLKDRFECRALTTDLNPDFFTTEEFTGIFNHWKNKVESREIVLNLDIKTLTVGTLLSSLTPAQLWKVSASLLALTTGVGAIAYWFGKNFGVVP